MKRAYYIQTLGCQMNYSDSERIEAVLNHMGFRKTDEMEKADMVIFNTCSVRQKAEDRVFGQMINIKKLRKQKPHLITAITGCMVRTTSHRHAENRDALLRRSKETDFVFRIEDLPKLPALIQACWGDTVPTDIHEANLKNYFNINPVYSSTAQAFVPIGTGCDNFCTYCIVPYSRKREKSRSMDDIVNECTRLVENGCLEITLLGQNVNSYGLSNLDKKTDEFNDMTTPFVDLLERVDALKEKGLKRLRFTSNHPKDLSDELIDAMARLETLMPYLHLPVQSGSNEVLKRMNRHYTADWYRNLIKKIRSAVPGIAISTDIIVGFCGETEEQFMETYTLFEDIKWDMAYLAQYSTRKGTFASQHMADDISAEIKSKRWHRLNKLLIQSSLQGHRAFQDKDVQVLVEQCKNGVCKGRSEHFKTVVFHADKNMTGTIQTVHVTKAREWQLEGELTKR
ncbi:tRNA (N6-isopentenyl adenosine(37)-C2)-methylthiotransferase MiaB [Candidatus Peregrinibacteria bacterium]|nr:tRNA (N6-isopentenyl adenosine(37)-C2)-methylthiotransferase MiaB [Candidatus Peregrinibacteria bacterium]